MEDGRRLVFDAACPEEMAFYVEEASGSIEVIQDD
jgi:hypothetical protein